MSSRKSKELSGCHIRIYSEDKLLLAMDSEVSGTRLAKTVFDLINSGEYYD